MADLKLEVTYKPDKSATLTELRAFVATLESLIDTTVAAPSEVDIALETDFEDDEQILVATWTV